MSASDSIASFLEACGVPHLMPTFNENKIDDLHLLQSLTRDELKELVPCLGERKKIEIALQMKKSVHSVILPAIEDVIPSDIEIFEINETEDPLAKKPKLSKFDAPSISSNFLLDKMLDVCNAPSTSSNILLAETSNIDNAPTISSVVSLNKTLHVSNTISDDKNSMIHDVLNTHDIINFDLRGFLTSNIIGRAILLKFTKTKSIDNKDRNHLCDIIICHFLNDGKRLNNSTISILADKIVDVFQGEKKSIYYVSPIGKSRSRFNKPEVAKGKLIDKHRNKLNMIRKTLAFSEVIAVEEKQNISPEIQDSQIWLKHNNEPLNEVLHHWKLSFPIRKIGQLSLSEYFEEWPILKAQTAIDLIEYDFQQKFNKEPLDICQKFENFFNVIYDKRKALLKPSDECLLNLIGDHITTDSKNVIRLHLLSSLVPPRGRAKTGKTYWKPSISEAREGLFLQVKIPGDIESAIQEKIDFMYKKGLTVQPYMITVGSNLCNVQAFYVIIDSKIYATKTFLESLKFCFQAYFVLDLQYTPESQHLWFLLQWELFNIISEKDINIPFVSDLLQFKS